VRRDNRVRAPPASAHVLGRSERSSDTHSHELYTVKISLPRIPRAVVSLELQDDHAAWVLDEVVVDEGDPLVGAGGCEPGRRDASPPMRKPFWRSFSDGGLPVDAIDAEAMLLLERRPLAGDSPRGRVWATTGCGTRV
jgi:hypothetical protein